MSEEEHREPPDLRRRRAWYWVGWIVLIVALVTLGVVLGPCDPPPPEPIPADCKPGEPCPVDVDTIGAPSEQAP